MRPTPTLRGEVLARYARDWLLDLQDIFDFVREPTVALRASVGSTEASEGPAARVGVVGPTRATRLSLPMINLSVTAAVHTRPFVQRRRDTAHLTRS